MTIVEKLGRGLAARKRWSAGPMRLELLKADVRGAILVL